jgi:glycosyltransferase involved in cell wall biosynthesis
MKPLPTHFREGGFARRGGHRQPLIECTVARSINILHIITSLATGGANMALCKLLEYQQIGRCRHHVLSLMRGGALRERVLATGAEVEDVGLRRGRVSVAAAIRLAAVVRRGRPDLVQGWMYHGNVAATLGSWSLGRRCPAVWGIRHSILDGSNEKPMTRGLIRLGAPLSRTAAAIVYCSKVSARQHERIGYDARKTVVIPNGFDCQAFQPRPEAGARLLNELDIPPDRTIIGHVARFHAMKDHHSLIAAVARLNAADQNVHLVMIGRGVEPDELQLATMIRRAGIGTRVSLLGERTDIPGLMSGFNILALSSSSGEAFPNVLGEAMASGVPCVATDVGDCTWIIDDTGVVVPPRDPEALAAGMATLARLSTKGRRELGARARQRVAENFEIGRVTQLYESLYGRVLDGDARP